MFILATLAEHLRASAQISDNQCLESFSDIPLLNRDVFGRPLAWFGLAVSVVRKYFTM